MSEKNNPFFERVKALSFVLLTAFGASSCDDAPKVERNPAENSTSGPQQEKPTQVYNLDVSEDVKLQMNDYGLYRETEEYMKIASMNMARHGGMVVPRELRKEIYILGQATGVPPEVFIEFAYAESHFNCDSENPSSSAGGCYHLLRDTIYEKIRGKKGTIWESVFPMSAHIDQNSEYDDGRKRYRVIDPKTGKEDNGLTRTYYLKVRSNSFLEGVLMADVLKDNAEILKHDKLKVSSHNLYGQWFFGPYTGRNYAQLRTSEPDAPILKIYGETIDDAMERGHHSVLNIGNKNIFFKETFVNTVMQELELETALTKQVQKDFSDQDMQSAYRDIVVTKIKQYQTAQENGEIVVSPFKKVSDVEAYFREVKKLSDDPVEFFQPNEELIKSIHTNGKSLKEDKPEDDKDRNYDDEFEDEDFQWDKRQAMYASIDNEPNPAG